MDLRSTPISTLSLDISKSDIITNLRFCRAALHIWTSDNHAAIEAAGTQQRRIQHVRPVGCGDQNHALVRFETIHFHQQRVQRLLALVVTSAKSRSAMAADSVDFIDENNARRVLLALLEKVADAARAHTDKHLYEVRTGNR